jgi:DNA-binding XRE family transcriptional regulator
MALSFAIDNLIMKNEIKLLNSGGEKMVKCILKNEISTRVMIAEKSGSLKTFANEIGISQTYLTQILKCDRSPSPTIAHKIANGLSLKIDEIFLIENVAIDNPC